MSSSSEEGGWSNRQGELEKHLQRQNGNDDEDEHPVEEQHQTRAELLQILHHRLDQLNVDVAQRDELDACKQIVAQLIWREEQLK